MKFIELNQKEPILQKRQNAKGAIVWYVKPIQLNRFASLILALTLLSGFLGFSVKKQGKVADKPQLYLIDKASIYVKNASAFENKVRLVAQKLAIPPEWLMAVMFSESRFDFRALNMKGSGAVGLIQFMPATLAEFKPRLSSEAVMNMGEVKQLDLVYMYLEQYRQKYGAYKSLTDLYLAILYPKAREYDYCGALYASPTKAYKQNAGLDEDKDGAVRVADIDNRMKRLFAGAYFACLPQFVEETIAENKDEAFQ